VTEGNQVTDAAWIRKFTQKMINKKLCNVDRCDEWNEKDFFSKDGSSCLLDTNDDQFSTAQFPVPWNVCREIKDKTSFFQYSADLGSYSDDPPENFCSNGAFCWVVNQFQCTDWYERNSYCDVTTIDIDFDIENFGFEDISLGACRQHCLKKKWCSAFLYQEDGRLCQLKYKYKEPYILRPKKGHVFWVKTEFVYYGKEYQIPRPSE